MLVYFKVTSFLHGWNDLKTNEEHFVLTVPSENGSEVIVKLFPNKSKVESVHKLSLSVELFDALKDKKFDKKRLSPEGDIEDLEGINAIPIPKEIRNELLDIESNITKSTRKVLNHFKYCLRISKIDTPLIKNSYLYWSLDESNWQKIELFISIPICPIIEYYVDENKAQYVQECLTNEFEPFLALKYLHKALEEQDSNVRWIDATIAAELAIKEFLIRKHPILEKLLLEAPAPPLSKLYGSILKEYAGEEYPKKKKIIEGGDKRNKIIHRPKHQIISEREVWCYIIDVETAIYYLLLLLYPNDQFIKNHYRFLSEIKF